MLCINVFCFFCFVLFFFSRHMPVNEFAPALGHLHSSIGAPVVNYIPYNRAVWHIRLLPKNHILRINWKYRCTYIHMYHVICIMYLYVSGAPIFCIFYILRLTYVYLYSSRGVCAKKRDNMVKLYRCTFSFTVYPKGCFSAIGISMFI